MPPAAGDKRTTLRDMPPANGDKRRIIRDMSPANGDKRRIIRDMSPANGDKRTTLRDMPPANGDKRTTLRDMPPATRDKRRITRDMSPAARDKRTTLRDMPPAARDKRRTLRDMSPAAGDKRRTTRDMSPAAGDKRSQDVLPPSRSAHFCPDALARGFAPQAPRHSSAAMPLWNNATWNAPGTLWGPAEPPPPLTRTRERTRTTMKRQRYYPTLLSEQGAWNGNFADKLPQYVTSLGLPPAAAAATVADARYLQYMLSQWLRDVRTYSQAATQALTQLETGTGSTPYVLPTFSPPQLPPGDPTATPPIPATVPVPPGALNRLFDFVQVIKRSPGYTQAIGEDLGIIGAEDTTEYPAPDFTTAVEMGSGCQCVKLRYHKRGHYAVAIHSRRGNEADFTLLAVSSTSPFEDERPLLVPGQPEVRHYKMRFWDSGSENGEWSDVASVTVSP